MNQKKRNRNEGDSDNGLGTLKVGSLEFAAFISDMKIYALDKRIHPIDGILFFEAYAYIKKGRIYKNFLDKISDLKGKKSFSFKTDSGNVHIKGKINVLYSHGEYDDEFGILKVIFCGECKSMSCKGPDFDEKLTKKKK